MEPTPLRIIIERARAAISLRMALANQGTREGAFKGWETRRRGGLPEAGGGSTDPRFAGTGYRSMEDLRARAAGVSAERIREICASDGVGLIPVHEGLAVVMSNPVFFDKAGREMRFDSQFLPKYLYGRGRGMNEADIERFRHVRDGIYAVRHDGNPAIVYNGRRTTEMPPPYGAQRAYSAKTSHGVTWAISWANKVYVRSIQERPKNRPPYR